MTCGFWVGPATPHCRMPMTNKMQARQPVVPSKSYFYNDISCPTLCYGWCIASHWYCNGSKSKSIRVHQFTSRDRHLLHDVVSRNCIIFIYCTVLRGSSNKLSLWRQQFEEPSAGINKWQQFEEPSAGINKSDRCVLRNIRHYYYFMWQNMLRTTLIRIFLCCNAPSYTGKSFIKMLPILAIHHRPTESQLVKGSHMLNHATSMRLDLPVSCMPD